MPNRSTHFASTNAKRYLHFLFVQHSRTSTLAIFLLTLGSVAEGFSVVVLFPMVSRLLRVDRSVEDQSTVDILLQNLIGAEPTTFTLMSLVLLGVTINAAFGFIALRQVGHIVANLATELRLTLIQGLFHARSSLFVIEKVGQLQNHLGLEATLSAESYRNACEFFSRLIQVAVYIILVFLMSVTMGLIAILVGVGVVLLTRGFIRTARSAGYQRVESMKVFTSKILDSLHALKAVRAMNRESQFLNQLSTDAAAVNAALKRQANAAAGLISAQEPLLLVGILCGLLYATNVADFDPATVAVLGFIFFRVSIQLRLAMFSYQQLCTQIPAYIEFRNTLELVESFAEIARHGHSLNTPIETIIFDEVGFTYCGDIVVNNASFDIPNQQLTVLIGPSGAGKSTLLDLLMGMQLPTHGEIRIDDIPLHSIESALWRQHIGYVPQEPALIHASVLENITLGDQSITESQAIDALKKAGGLKFVQETEQGLHTSVGERGTRFSAGQRQRIALARALVCRPKLLLLDEVTASLDRVTAQSVVNVLLDLRQHTTIIAVTHQQELVVAADKLYCVEGGHVRPVTVDAAKLLTSDFSNID